jgi:hypothetical protein
MDMVERVAKAIVLRSIERGHPVHPLVVLDLARAAIEAMREPTDEQRNNYYELSHRTATFFDAHWERAIDAILMTDEMWLAVEDLRVIIDAGFKKV